MRNTFYIKKGRRYVPVSDYDSDLCDSYSYGAHLVVVKPGMKSRRSLVDPAFAPMIAAGMFACDAMTKAVIEASECQPGTKPITQEQKAAWEQLKKAFGNERYHLSWPSAFDVVEVGVRAMQEEADKMLENPAVRKAYERFLMMVELTREHTNEDV